MGFWQRLFNIGGRRVEVRYVSAAAHVLGLSEAELYLTQPALRAVVSYIADNVAGIPLKCYVREGDNERRRDTEGPLPSVLRRPNGHMTGHELIRMTMSDLCLYGYAVWYVIPDADSASGWTIEPLPSAWTQPSTSDGMTAGSYTVANPASSAIETFDADDCIMFALYSPNGIMDAASPVAALKQVLSEQVHAWEYRNQVWENGGRVSQVIERPANAPVWDPEDRDRFALSWKNRFAGDKGTDSGGTPILEDGMKLVQTQFNAREAQWQEATRIAREDVAAVYHINPSLIWHTDAQTYASAKDAARALYAETLQPVLDMLSERMNAFLAPKVGADPREYVEFDMSKKLEASFEEQASVLQSAVGGPWMERNEARAKFNLPPIEGADQLIVPLNVIEGGLASPNDTSPYGGYDAGAPQLKSAAPEPIARIKAAPDTHASMDVAGVLRAFFKRQRKKVESAIESAKAKGVKADGDWPSWWDAERWDRELADDLEAVFAENAEEAARRTLRELGRDPDGYRAEATVHFIRAMAEGKAKAVNNVTYRQLQRALADDISEDADGATPAGVFDKAEAERADHTGISFATALTGWAALEAVEQSMPASRYKRMKTWIVTSSNPRAEHAAMDGETVPVEELFSNGANYPGDQVLTPEESCNCQCQVEITIWEV